MFDRIVRVLKRHEDEIMSYTLGNDVGEDKIRYAETYKHEWKMHSEMVATTISKLIEYGEEISSIGFAYTIVNEWLGVMTFDDGDLNMRALTELCEEMLLEVYSELLNDLRTE